MPSPVMTTRRILVLRKFASARVPFKRSHGLHACAPQTSRELDLLCARHLPRRQDSQPALRGAGVLLEELHRIANGQDVLGGVIGNFAAKLLLESHHEFDRI